MKPTNFIFVKPPELCENCGESLRNIVATVDDETTKVMHFCPHNQTVILLHLENQGGQRAVTRWIFESPASEQYAIDLATEFGKESGANLKMLTGSTIQ
jgi:hypothetical protein